MLYPVELPPSNESIIESLKPLRQQWFFPFHLFHINSIHGKFAKPKNRFVLLFVN